MSDKFKCHDCNDTGIIPEFPGTICHCITDNGIIARSIVLYPAIRPRNYLHEGQRMGYVQGMKEMRNILLPNIKKD